MSVDTLSRRALLEMQQDGDFAPRHKVWPPEGYVAPTAEEFAGLLRAAEHHQSRYLYPSHWDRLTGDEVLRRAQLCELAGPSLRGQLATAVHGYVRALRDELRRRGIVYRSLAVLRCEACSHAAERLFEATQATHPGLENRSGTRIASAWFCARCWSGYTLGDLADGPADEDGTGDEA
ncbi:hypothetical protein ABTY20_19175 [Streptomyces sp. NPDC126497]|uniref:hypothetical protein n=1 Tax=Streptomyces sp. NPDC126497 TaxID=3155313 RepID=UPI003328002C